MRSLTILIRAAVFLSLLPAAFSQTITASLSGFVRDARQHPGSRSDCVVSGMPTWPLHARRRTVNTWRSKSLP
ncbi:MAG: hypothetical protein M3Y07_16370 [Acidobacteriota bacterium]|nr:hypothetical protein [Acidobacteriota bacterium]